MEAKVTDAELLDLAEKSWRSMAAIVGQEMEGGKVVSPTSTATHKHGNMHFCRDFQPWAGEQRDNADPLLTKVSGVRNKSQQRKFHMII